ncbi:MAG: Histidine kinase [Campylobacterota bacterium]|nr:Histidine kinase [Campylobacterota bacterium]
MIKNIRVKLLFFIGLFLIVVFSIFAVLLTNSLKKSHEQYIETTLSMVTKDLEYEFLNEEKYNINVLKEEFDIETLYVQIVKVSGDAKTILEKSYDLQGCELDYKNIDIKSLQESKIYLSKQKNGNLTNAKIKVATAMVSVGKQEPLILQFGMPYDRYPPFVKNTIFTLFVSLPLLLIIILMAINIVISKSLSQINIVLDEVKGVKVDNFSIKIPQTNVAKEIDALIDTFNALLEKIYISYKKIREFGQNASHELKTPLTVIKGEVEVGLRRDRSADEYKEILKIVQSEVNYLQDVIEKILFLSNNDENIIKDSFEEVNVEEIVNEVLEEYRVFAFSKNIRFVSDISSVTVRANPLFLKIAIGNLVQNAIKYSKENSAIEIVLNENMFSIKDFGIGIAKSELENIFDRFYRVDKVRSNSSGSGLGLSIVKTIIDIHGFSIVVDSVEGEFTTFSILFHK